MTQEEKQLLLEDLCARLRYGVVCRTSVGDYRLLGIDVNIGNVMHLDSPIYDEGDGYFDMDYQEVKPYLRPMSSMTEEEKAQVQTFMDIVTDENYGDGYSPSAWDAMNGFVQYCDSHHLDHRGLIVKGLALPATEGMYNI